VDQENGEDKVMPPLEKVIQSCEKTEDPLQSVKFVPTEDTAKKDVVELGPLRI
jgi:hypothetical protein